MTGPAGHDWEGWPFGRNLYVAEIFSLIQRVPGVKHVLDVELSTRPVIPGKEFPPESEEPGRDDTEASDVAREGREVRELSTVDQKVIRVPTDTLLCSLDHEITLAALGEEEEGEDEPG